MPSVVNIPADGKPSRAQWWFAQMRAAINDGLATEHLPEETQPEIALGEQQLPPSDRNERSNA